MRRAALTPARGNPSAFGRGTLWARTYGLACALLVIFAPGRLKAQIGVFHHDSAAGTSGSATIASFTVSGLPSGDSYFIVGVSCFATLNSSAPYCSASNPITWGGSSSFSWTLIGGSTTSNFRAVDMWQLRNPTGTGTIGVSLGGTIKVVAGMVLVGGVATASPFGTFVQNNGSNNAPTAPAATTVVGDLVVSAAGAYQTLCGTASPPTGCTPTSPQANQWELYSSTSSSNISGFGSTVVATTTSTTMSWTASGSNNWAIGAVPLHPYVVKRKGQVVVARLEPIRGKVLPATAGN